MFTSKDILEWKSFPPDLTGREVTVIGMARSGIAAAILLHTMGCKVFVSESQKNQGLKENVSKLQSLNIDFELAGHTDRVLTADFIVRSPGVPADIDILKKARDRGIVIISEIELASWFCPAPVIAVTGSNGKTTTVEWIGDLFRRLGKNVAVCGNVGTSFSSLVLTLKSEDVVVLEVSSFQLENIVRFAPDIAVITNLSPDHLDRYDSYEDYIKAKCRIFENQNSGETIIFNRGDQELSNRVLEASVRKLSFGLDDNFERGAGIKSDDLVISDATGFHSLMRRDENSLRGQHNLENALAVACVASCMKVPTEILRQSLQKFPGVPHRLETVIESRGILWVNDSKATNVASGLVALDSFDRAIILLAGGRDKGSDFKTIASRVSGKAKHAILFGEAGPAIEKAWSSIVTLSRVASMADAVALASSIAQGSDVVILSPMCASFDEFDNYEHRGDTFKKLVNESVA